MSRMTMGGKQFRRLFDSFQPVDRFSDFVQQKEHKA